MKKILCICLCVILLFAGCQRTDPNKFRLDKVQDIKGETSIEKYSRYYDSYTDRLTPSDKYGELLPFAGRYLMPKEDGWMEYSVRYGLCTVEGKIVVDPVFDYIYTISLGTQDYYVLSYVPKIADIEQYIKDDSGETDIFAEHSVLAKTDGSAVLEMKGDSSVGVASGRNTADNRIIVREYSADDDFNYNIDLSLYDSDLRPVSKIEGLANSPMLPVTDGILEVMRVEEGDRNNYICSYVDINGKEVISGEKFSQVWEFSNGLAAVKDKESGLVGYINTKGSYVINPQYDNAGEFNEKGYAYVCRDDKFFIIDKSGRNMLGDEFSDYITMGSNGMVYWLSSDNRPPVYKRIDTNEPIECPICKETSRNREMYSCYNSVKDDGDEYYCHSGCTDGFTLFKWDGELIEHIKYDGKYAAVYGSGITDKYILAPVYADESYNTLIYDRDKKEVVKKLDEKYSVDNVIGDRIILYCSYEPVLDENGNVTDNDYTKRFWGEYSPDKDEIVEKYTYFTKHNTGRGDHFVYIKDGYSYLCGENGKIIIKIRLSDDD